MESPDAWAFLHPSKMLEVVADRDGAASQSWTAALARSWTFFAEFPENCTTISGPLSVDCFQTLWNATLCEVAGSLYPADAAFIAAAPYMGFNLM